MKTAHKKRMMAQRRQAKKARHEHDRKLVRKLWHISEKVRVGQYEGVKQSPLLHLNWDRVKAWIT